MTLLQQLTERLLHGFPLAHGPVNLLLVREIERNRPVALLMVKLERLRNRIGTVSFPVGVHNGAKCHTGARDTIDSVMGFDVVSVGHYSHTMDYAPSPRPSPPRHGGVLRIVSARRVRRSS
jgi:hypothetical protein